MVVKRLQLIEEFRKLAPGEKASLLDELWTELATEAQRSGLSEAERRAIDARLTAIDGDPRPDRAWSELRSEFLSKP